MPVCKHLSHIWLLSFGWLLTVRPVDSTYTYDDRQSSDCPLEDYYQHALLQPLPDAWASCRRDPATGVAWPPGETPYLQLNICTETFVFSSDTLARWRECLSSFDIKWCKLTAHGTVVVNVTSDQHHYIPFNVTPDQRRYIPFNVTSDQRRYIPFNVTSDQRRYIPFNVTSDQRRYIPFNVTSDQRRYIPFNVTSDQRRYIPYSNGSLCHQPTSDTMLCERRPLAVSDCDMAVFSFDNPYVPVCLTWNSIQIAVSARCQSTTGICIRYKANGKSCPQTEDDSAQLPRNAVIGIAVACVLILVILMALITLYVIRRRRQHAPASSASSIQSTNSPKQNVPKTKKGIRPHLDGNSSRTKSTGGRANSHFTNGGHAPGNNSNTYTSHSNVSWRDQTNHHVSTVDDRTYASIDVALGVSSEYLGLDETTSYSHAYQTLVINDPNLRPPMPLPLQVADQPLPYYSVAEANDVMTTNGPGDTASGQYVELVEDNTFPNLAISDGYLVPVSSYIQETTRQPHPMVSLVSNRSTHKLPHDREMPLY